MPRTAETITLGCSVCRNINFRGVIARPFLIFWPVFVELCFFQQDCNEKWIIKWLENGMGFASRGGIRWVRTVVEECLLIYISHFYKRNGSLPHGDAHSRLMKSRNLQKRLLPRGEARGNPLSVFVRTAMLKAISILPPKLPWCYAQRPHFTSRKMGSHLAILRPGSPIASWVALLEGSPQTSSFPRWKVRLKPFTFWTCENSSGFCM